MHTLIRTTSVGLVGGISVSTFVFTSMGIDGWRSTLSGSPRGVLLVASLVRHGVNLMASMFSAFHRTSSVTLLMARVL